MTNPEMLEMVRRNCLAANADNRAVCELMTESDTLALGCMLALVVLALDIRIFRAFNGRAVKPARPRTVYVSPRIPDQGCFEEMSNAS